MLRSLARSRRATSVGRVRARALNLSAFDGEKTRKKSAEELRMEAEAMEELSVFRALGGLVAAAAGGGLVFVLGAGAVATVAGGLAGALAPGVAAKRENERRERREALERELAEVSSWRWGGRAKRREIQGKIDALDA